MAIQSLTFTNDNRTKALRTNSQKSTISTGKVVIQQIRELVQMHFGVFTKPTFGPNSQNEYNLIYILQKMPIGFQVWFVFLNILTTPNTEGE